MMVKVLLLEELKARLATSMEVQFVPSYVGIKGTSGKGQTSTSMVGENLTEKRAWNLFFLV